MLVANHVERTFLFQNERRPLRLSDPDEKLTPEAVLDHYSHQYPLLVTAKVEGPELRNDLLEYQFVSTIGTKG
ncbi:MAG TPA: PRTRC system protein C [Chitinophagaceae bacterium]|nr:PRTRC system protein C [Chitinophagaceae bacterium]